jgi:hypothetical protein
MTLVQYLPSGADGDALTTTNVPCTQVLPATNTGTNGSTFSLQGGKTRYRFYAPNSLQAFVRVSATSSNVQSFRGLLRRLPTVAITNPRLIMVGRHASGQIIRLQMTSSYQLQMQSGVSGFAALGSATSISGGLLADTDYEVTMDYKVGTSTTTSYVRLQVFTPGSSTPLAGGSITVSAVNLGTAPVVAYDMGSNDTTASALDVTWSDVQFENDRTQTSNIPSSIPSLYVAPGPKIIPGSIALIGDSTLDQDGNGETNLRAALVARGFTAPKTFFYALGGKPIMIPDAAGFTAVDNMNQARAYLGGEPETWFFNLGSNGHHDGDATNVGWINTVLDQVATGSRVYWSGISQRDGFDNGTSSVTTRQHWNDIAKPVVEARSFGNWSDWNAYIKSYPGGDYNYWLSDSVHMTAQGYAVKNVFIVSEVTGDKFGTAAATFTLSTSAAGSVQTSGSASTALTLSTLATGSRDSGGTSQASLTLSTAATGSRSSTGTAGTSLTLTTAATGSRTSSGTTAAGLTFTTSATGSTSNSGSAATTITLSTAASGSAPGVGTAQGSAAVALMLSTAATGTKTSQGFASASVSLSTAASGTRTSSGAASVSVSLTALASGTAPAVSGNQGSAAVTLSLSTLASGSRTSSGVAPLVFSVTTTAAGRHSSTGTANVVFNLVTNAYGTNTSAPSAVMQNKHYHWNGITWKPSKKRIALTP